MNAKIVDRRGIATLWRRGGNSRRLEYAVTFGTRTQPETWWPKKKEIWPSKTDIVRGWILHLLNGTKVEGRTGKYETYYVSHFGRYLFVGRSGAVRSSKTPHVTKSVSVTHTAQRKAYTWWAREGWRLNTVGKEEE